MKAFSRATPDTVLPLLTSCSYSRCQSQLFCPSALQASLGDMCGAFQTKACSAAALISGAFQIKACSPAALMRGSWRLTAVSFLGIHWGSINGRLASCDASWSCWMTARRQT